ncbi:MAG: thiamine-binding protein [Clostridiales bacterium]|nr:thiamine-binding protein [Clostridiales bacterium]
MFDTSIAIQVLPEAENDAELVRVVDEVIAYIKSTGYHTYVGPFETAVEGDYAGLMEIVKNCQLICLKAGAPSVMSYVKISYKPEGGVLTIDEKVTKHHL